MRNNPFQNVGNRLGNALGALAYYADGARAQGSQRVAQQQRQDAARKAAGNENVQRIQRGIPNTRGGGAAELPSWQTRTDQQRQNILVGDKAKKTATDAAKAAADAKTKKEAGGHNAEGKKDEQLDPTEMTDQFYADFNAYSKKNLDGMGWYDFMMVDPNSEEDKAMWQAMANDPTMGRYYVGMIDDAGGFDEFWEESTQPTIDEIMSDQALQRAQFGYSGGDTMNAIFHGLANDQYGGFAPTVGGDDTINLAKLYDNDPELAAMTMMYMYGMDALVNDQEGLKEDPFALAKMNDYLALGNMEYSQNPSYNFNVGEVPDIDGIDHADPAAYSRSAEENWGSVPGYGLPELGARALMNEVFDAGYRERPEVTSLYDEYYAQGGE